MPVHALLFFSLRALRCAVHGFGMHAPGATLQPVVRVNEADDPRTFGTMTFVVTPRGIGVIRSVKRDRQSRVAIYTVHTRDAELELPGHHLALAPRPRRRFEYPPRDQFAVRFTPNDLLRLKPGVSLHGLMRL